MIEQEPVAKEELKPEPKPEEPPPTLGTGIKGDGPPDGFGLSGSGKGGRVGGNGGTGSGGNRSQWGWYASQVSSTIIDALKQNRKTRSAVMSTIKVRIWADPTTGRVTRAKLVESTGNAAVDTALQNEVLTGLQLREPPPAGMPSPIVLRLSARRGI